MSEKPILFSGPMVRAILDGRKTQTRRVVKPQPDDVWPRPESAFRHPMGGDTDGLRYGLDVIPAVCPYGKPGDRLWCRTSFLAGYGNNRSNLYYGLTDDSIMVFHRGHETITTCEWNPSKRNTHVSQRGLHGWVRRPDILTDKIQGLWEKGIRGLVSAERNQNAQGLPKYLNVPREHQSNQVGASFGLHGFSWDAAFAVFTGKAFGREPKQQQAKQSILGNPSRKLGRQKSSREGGIRGEASNVKSQRSGSGTYSMGNIKGPLQPETCGEGLGSFAGWNIRHLQKSLVKKPSIFMPRWASRLTLEITGVRVERLQAISEDDAKAEGVRVRTDCHEDYTRMYEMANGVEMTPFAKDAFADLWQSINGAESWDANPYVWVVSFKRVGGAS